MIVSLGSPGCVASGKDCTKHDAQLMISIIMDKNVPLPPPLSQLPKAALTRSVVPAGSPVFVQDAPTHAIFFVEAGSVLLTRYSEAGSAIPVFRATSGETFAEAALFAESYHCTAVAQSDTKIIAFRKSEVLRTMSNDAAFSFQLPRMFAQQVQLYRRKLEILAIKNAEDRVLTALSDGWLKTTVTDFAAEIGLSQEATARALSELVKTRKVTKLGRGRYQIAPR